MAIRPCSSSQEVSWALSHSTALAATCSSPECLWMPVGRKPGEEAHRAVYAQCIKSILLHVPLGIFGQYKNTGCKDLDTVPWPQAASPARGACASPLQYDSHSWDTACGCPSVLHLASWMVQGASNALPACFCARCVSYTHIMNRNNKNNNMYYFISYWFPLIPPLFYHFNWVPSLVLSVHYTSYLLSPISFIQALQSHCMCQHQHIFCPQSLTLNS